MSNDVNIYDIVLPALNDNPILSSEELTMHRQMKVFKLRHKAAFIVLLIERIYFCQNVFRHFLTKAADSFNLRCSRISCKSLRAD